MPSANYNKAAQLDPARAGQYNFNIGAVLTNAGKVDDAIVAFDKVIAADPTKADAYYWKGVNMIGKATLKGDKMVAPEGTAEAFNKYLELAPTGNYAQPAKDMLASIGASVETGFNKKKATARRNSVNSILRTRAASRAAFLSFARAAQRKGNRVVGY